MNRISRRRFGVLGGLLPLRRAVAQHAALSSKAYRYEDLPVLSRASGKTRPIFNGELRSGFAVEMHETELAAGQAPHPPHRHSHEEIILVREGTMEVTISGRGARLGPGSAAFMAADEEHGWRNVGDTTARYCIVALGPDLHYRQRAGAPTSSRAK